jgi:hypothetical protein
MNVVCDHKDCPAAATHVVFIKTGCLALCGHHTRSLRHALNRKGGYIALIAALSHSERASAMETATPTPAPTPTNS